MVKDLQLFFILLQQLCASGALPLADFHCIYCLEILVTLDTFYLGCSATVIFVLYFPFVNQIEYYIYLYNIYFFVL